MEHEPPTSFLLHASPPSPQAVCIPGRVCGSCHIRTSGSKGLFIRRLNGVPLHGPPSLKSLLNGPARCDTHFSLAHMLRTEERAQSVATATHVNKQEVTARAPPGWLGERTHASASDANERTHDERGENAIVVELKMSL